MAGYTHSHYHDFDIEIYGLQDSVLKQAHTLSVKCHFSGLWGWSLMSCYRAFKGQKATLQCLRGQLSPFYHSCPVLSALITLSFFLTTFLYSILFISLFILLKGYFTQIWQFHQYLLYSLSCLSKSVLPIKTREWHTDHAYIKLNAYSKSSSIFLWGTVHVVIPLNIFAAALKFHYSLCIFKQACYAQLENYQCLNLNCLILSQIDTNCFWRFFKNSL